MKAKTTVTLARVLCGTAILITHMVTGVNSTFVMIGIALLGLPIEVIQKDEKDEKEG